MIEEISATELRRRIDGGDDIQLIDVRQPDEYAFAKINGAKLIPLGEVVRRMNEIDPGRETVVHCKMGGRSAKAIEMLRQAGVQAIFGPGTNLVEAAGEVLKLLGHNLPPLEEAAE